MSVRWAIEWRKPRKVLGLLKGFRALLVILAVILVPLIHGKSDGTLKVTFIGTGGPEVSAERSGIATLVTAGAEQVLFDAGRNLMQNLYEAGVDPREVTSIVLSHLHNDHIEGLATLWMTGWFLLGRTEPLQVWGPPGTKDMIEGMYSMYQFDIEHRANDFNDRDHLKIQVTEFENDGLILDLQGLRITAFAVEHDDGNPAFGYRIDHSGHTILLTGDTRLCQSLIGYGKNVDLMVTNILAMPEELARKPEMQGVVAKLMTIPEAVSLFEATEPRKAVYTHFVTKGLEVLDPDAFIARLTRESGYSGELFLAKDGWSIDFPALNAIPPPDVGSLPQLDRKKDYVD